MDWTTILGLAARHMLTAAGTWLVAHGLLPTESADQFVGGGMIFVGVVWSLIQKWRQPPPVPPGIVRALPLLLVLPLLTGCLTDEQIARGKSLIDRINNRVASIDEAVHGLCRGPDGSPGIIPRLNTDASVAACLVRANGTAQGVIAAVASYGDTFCRNPTSKNLSALAKNAAGGLYAAMNATAAGCSAQ